MRWFLLALVLLVCLLVAMVLAGAMLPVKHQVQGVATVHQNPEFVWNLVADAEKQPKWRPKVVRVERLPDRDGHPVWREYYKNGQRLAFETIASDPPKRLVRKIVDESAFGGQWEIALLPTAEGTEVRVTERGEVYNPVFRFVSHFLIGQEKTIQEYLADMKNVSDARH